MSTIYIPYHLEKEPSLAARALLHATLKHMGDFQTELCRIIAEKYGISEEDIFSTVESHPRFKELLVNPMIHDIMGAQTEAEAKEKEQKGVVVTSSSSENSGTPAEKKNVFVKCADGKVKKVKKVAGGGAAQKLIDGFVTVSKSQP
jgi:hypothetical protein